ncbi:hypothetical protein EJB05_23468, partial [Eragrostis curvula]
MAAKNSAAASDSYGDQEAGFAKLQGENFAYLMQKYSIILGRFTKKSKVDLDLSNFGGRVMHSSRRSARIFYDFKHRHFALEVLGRHGCTIQGVTYHPGSDPIKLDSQDLIEIAGKRIYFLLPKRSIFATFASQRTTPSEAQPSSVTAPDNYGVSADSTGTPDGHVSAAL